MLHNFNYDLNENTRLENRTNVHVENCLKLIETAWDYHTQSQPLGTVHPKYRTDVPLLPSVGFFIYLVNKYI